MIAFTRFLTIFDKENSFSYKFIFFKILIKNFLHMLQEGKNYIFTETTLKLKVLYDS